MVWAKAAVVSAVGSLFLLSPRAAVNQRYIGLTPGGIRIEATVVPSHLAKSPTVLLIGGLHGNDASVGIVAEEARKFARIARNKRRFRLLSIPLANPEGSKLIFPPAGTAYRDNAESHELWRWIAIQAPDLVLIVANDDFGMADALSRNAIAGVGTVPARRIVPTLVAGANPGILGSVPADLPPSEAHREIERRLGRSPRQLADELARYYGHTFPDAIYINSIALIGQVRLGSVMEARSLVEPYVDGSKDSLARPTSLHLAGHLIFAELAARTGDARYL